MRITTRTKCFLFLVLFMMGGIYCGMNTRWGVHVLLDIVGEIGEADERFRDADAGPLKVTASLVPVNQVELPEQIQQPSGIKHRNGQVYICTDQTEIFVLDESFEKQSEPVTLLSGPLLLKQGSLEGIEVDGNQLVAVGEFGSIQTWKIQAENRWVKSESLALPTGIQVMEFSGITDSPHGRFATSEDEASLIDLEQGTRQPLDVSEVLQEGRPFEGYIFTGIAYGDGYFYVLSEQYTSVLVVEPTTFRVVAVLGVETGTASDLSYHDGKLYVVIDHNYSEPRKPVAVYEIDSVVDTL